MSMVIWIGCLRVLEDCEQGEKRGGSGGRGETPQLRNLKTFCDDWRSFDFVSQNIHNTKVLGVGDVYLYGFSFPQRYAKEGCYINRMPK